MDHLTCRVIMKGRPNFTAHAGGEAMSGKFVLMPQRGGAQEFKEVGGCVLLCAVMSLLRKPSMPGFMWRLRMKDARDQGMQQFFCAEPGLAGTAKWPLSN